MTVSQFPLGRVRGGAMPLAAITAAFADVIAGPGGDTAPCIEVFDHRRRARLVVRRLPDAPCNFAIQLLLSDDRDSDYEECWGAMLRLSSATLAVEDIQTWDGQPAAYALREDVFVTLAMAREGLSQGKLSRAAYESYQC